MERLQGRLFKLHDTVRYRTAIPTVQVYVRNYIVRLLHDFSF